jgi:hypothetical protein
MTLREWATPLTIGSFLLISATGVLMFFHLDTGLNKAAHEWLGWGLLAAVGLHAAANVSAFKRYFTRPATAAVIGSFIVLLAASFVSPPGQPDKPPHLMAVQAVLDAPIELAAQLAGKDPQNILSRLDAAGFDISRGNSLRAASGTTRERQMKALAIVFSPPGS